MYSVLMENFSVNCEITGASVSYFHMSDECVMKRLNL